MTGVRTCGLLVLARFRRDGSLAHSLLIRHTDNCPNDCSRHGVCRPISYIATTEASGSTDASSAVAAFGVTYTNWEASSSYACVCDFGRVGGDCSKRTHTARGTLHVSTLTRMPTALACAGTTGTCPRGDDPTTTYNRDYAFTVTTDNTASAALSGSMTFWFNGQVTTVSLGADATDGVTDASSCKASFESLPNVAEVFCQKGTVDGTKKSTTWTVRVKAFVNNYENNVHTHDGNPSINEWACNSYVGWVSVWRPCR